MQTFTLGTKLCFGENALDALKTLGAKRVLIVTDQFFEKNGTAARIAGLCGAETRIFSDVRPDPPLSLVAEGVCVLREFSPEAIIALGGGSAIDCAKGILSLGQTEARFIAIPTTSGSGSEVTSFAILTHDGVKHPLVEEALRPSMAILDASLLEQLPPALIADTGMDVLAHCAEAIAAKNASPFSDALAAAAFRTALEQLPASYALAVGGAVRIDRRTARSALHCAATMAGIAFDNAGLGACHALSHALGGAFHLAHGRINGVLLPHVIEFNAATEPQPYRRLASFCGLSGARGLSFAVQRVRRQLQMPATLTQAGLERKALLASAEAIAEAACADPCVASNPRPLSKADFLALLRSAL